MSSSKFPATSIGRSSGRQIASTSTEDPLSITPTAATTNYVPYTPRQRVVTTGSSTTGTVQSVNVTSVEGREGSINGGNSGSGLGAADRLQMMQAGVDAGSTGRAMVERLIEVGYGDEEWRDVWAALTSENKPTLILPLEVSDDKDKITPALVKDHILFGDVGAKRDAPVAVITLSGIRGTLSSNGEGPGATLTFQSSLHPASPRFQSSPTDLPPIPALPPTHLFPSYQFPTSTVISLTLHSSASTSSPARKPPLPPRPQPQTNVSRLANPFASLFNKVPTPTHSPAPSVSSLDLETTTVISAVTVDKRLVFDDIASRILTALKSDAGLSDAPPWVLERVQTFSASFLPFAQDKGKHMVQDVEYSADVLSEMVQDLYGEVEDAGPSVVDLVEKAVCGVFYDRLFRPPECADAQHDEALASRVAALNNDEVEDVVKTCGECLIRLEGAYTPKEKARLMVETHKAIVDGLVKLPPVRLRREGEVLGGETKAPEMMVESTVTEEPEPEVPTAKTAQTDVSLDILFPFLIFCVVRANPPRLVSHMRYCLVNLLAVVEFLENVDLGSLGLGTSVISAPPLVNITSSSPSPPRSRAASVSSAVLREQVDALAGSANKVLSGSFGMLRSLLPDGPTVGEGSMVRGMLRRESVFSIKSILPGGAEKEKEEEMRPVSRATTRGGTTDGEYSASEDQDDDSEDGGEGDEDDEDEDEAEYDGRDARSIRSFESMMKNSKGKKVAGRKSLSDRLSGITGKKSATLPIPRSPSPVTPVTARPKLNLAPPKKRFLECASDGSDLRLRDVAELVREYRRVVEGVRSMGGFSE
ncbi:hypothetical protein BDZ89DRAFT_1079548 [Hymenopellis radicata]|nr:hypothetical protein BDZ89DRAFT_1079548 [Hymenopellis radicata]